MQSLNLSIDQVYLAAIGNDCDVTKRAIDDQSALSLVRAHCCRRANAVCSASSSLLPTDELVVGLSRCPLGATRNFVLEMDCLAIWIDLNTSIAGAGSGAKWRQGLRLHVAVLAIDSNEIRASRGGLGTGLEIHRGERPRRRTMDDQRCISASDQEVQRDVVHSSGVGQGRFREQTALLSAALSAASMISLFSF